MSWVLCLDNWRKTPTYSETVKGKATPDLRLEGQEEGRMFKRKRTPDKLYKMLLSLRLPKARKRSWNSWEVNGVAKNLQGIYRMARRPCSLTNQPCWNILSFFPTDRIKTNTGQSHLTKQTKQTPLHLITYVPSALSGNRGLIIKGTGKDLCSGKRDIEKQ